MRFPDDVKARPRELSVVTRIIEMEPAGVSGTVTLSDQRSYIKIKILYGKNPTEIHGAFSEVCGEFTVGRSTVSRCANCFRGGWVRRDNGTRPQRPRTSTYERSVKLVADSLEEDRRAKHLKYFLEPLEQELRRKLHRNQPQLRMAGPLITHDNVRPHTADVVRPVVQALVHQTSTYSQS